MKIQSLQPDKIVHLISDKILIRSEQDILDLIGETELQDLVLHDYNFEPEFFDLSTQKLGSVLQKLTNYQIRLAIIGDFSKYPSTVLPDFIRESNQHKQYLFVSSLEEVQNLWNL